MRSMRFRLQMILLISLGVGGTFGSKAYQARLALEETQARAQQSLEVRNLLEACVDADSARTVSEASSQLSKIKSSLQPEVRQTAIADFLKTLASSDHRWLKPRTTIIFDQEKTVFQESQKRLHELFEQTEKNAAISMIGLALGLLTLAMLISRRILRPLDRLSRRMMDFLVDRYSFQFAQPEGNELGDLHRTFNSLAQRVINTMDELKTLDQAKSEFLNIASHELRTPLTSIKGSLSLLGGGMIGTVDPSCMRLIKIAEVETDRLIRLINDLLDLAKIEAGKLPLVCSWLYWDDTVSKTTEGLMGLASKADVNIKVEQAPGLEVFMDHDRVQQVLTNLISNAIKFSPPGSWVTVSVGRTSRGEVLVNVRDQGPGIAAEDSELIFQRFRQGATPENPLVKGTGLGLAIAKALVAEHGGDIGLESELGHGATFWFTLPKWRDDESSSEEPSRETTAFSQASDQVPPRAA